jgi:hypothetical protein
MSAPGDAISSQIRLLEEAADQLETAAQHCRVAAGHFRDSEIPRAGAHAWAAQGHLLEAEERLQASARLHATRAVPG